jgi:hypothetical protein
VDDEEGHDIGNYGAVLSIWDRLFGTWSLASSSRPVRFGAANAPAATVWDLAWHPVRVFVRFFSVRIGSQSDPARKKVCAVPSEGLTEVVQKVQSSSQL